MSDNEQNEIQERKSRRFAFQCNGKTKRIQIIPHIQDNYDEFKKLIKTKFKLNVVNKIEYSLKDEDDDGIYEIDDFEDYQELYDRDNNIKLIYVNRENQHRSNELNGNRARSDIEQRENSRNSTLTAQQSAIAKLAITDIPFKFGGKMGENVKHFQIKIERYCTNNNIQNESLLKLILNGKIIKDSAFEYLQRATHSIYDQELSTEQQLKLIWELLGKKYNKTNGVLYYKKKLQSIQQNKMKLKDYLETFRDILNDLNLEIEIQGEYDRKYQNISGYEAAELFMKGLNDELKTKIIDEAMNKFNTANIDMLALEKLVNIMIEKEDYLDTINGDKDNNESQTELIENKVNNEAKDNNESQTVFSIESEIETIINNKISAYLENRGNGKFGTYYSSGIRCKSGINCKFGINCRYVHTEEEMNRFKQRDNNYNYNYNKNKYGNKDNPFNRNLNNDNTQKANDNNTQKANNDNTQKVNINNIDQRKTTDFDRSNQKQLKQQIIEEIQNGINQIQIEQPRNKQNYDNNNGYYFQEY